MKTDKFYVEQWSTGWTVFNRSTDTNNGIVYGDYHYAVRVAEQSNIEDKFIDMGE